MSVPNTRRSVRADLEHIGVRPGSTLMVHSSLRQVGWTVGGAVAVVNALLDVIGASGTLVMPAESPTGSDPAEWNPPVPDEWHETIREHLPVFDPATTPSTMGAIAEAFRTLPGALRSGHPTLSICAYGPLAEQIVADHPLEFGEGPGSPFERMYDLDADILLLGVGFDRCSFLHYAESLIPDRRTTTTRLVVERAGDRVWVEVPTMATDAGVLFRPAGEYFVTCHPVIRGQVGRAVARRFPARALVDTTQSFFEQQLG